ncbi:hypothetical protein AXH25_04470 (plasmid) [Borrelia miyamotoi]|nr:hypothetical protein AXH25_04470 [Borrelia miyamotoi]
MVLSFIFMLSLFICSCGGSSSESVKVTHYSNKGKATISVNISNDSGTCVIYYPYISGDKKYLLVDFNISTNKPLNLLKVLFNGVKVDHKYLWLSYDQQLKLNWEQYFLPFDDSIELTHFIIHLEPSLGEHLQLLEFANKEGLKFDIECIERDSGMKRKISFHLSAGNSKKFFDLLDNLISF